VKQQNEQIERGASNQPVPQPSIADRYSDLLELLDRHQRQGLIVRLTVGYYDGWRPNGGFAPARRVMRSRLACWGSGRAG